MIKRAGDKLGNRCTRTNNGRLPWPCHLDLFFKRCIPVCSYILVSLTYKIYTTRGIPDASTYMHTYIFHHSSTWITPCKEMAARAATPQRTRRAIPTVSDWKSWRAETALAMKYIRTFDSLGPCVPIGLSQLWSLWLCLAGRIVLLFLQSFCKLADSTCDLTGHKREDFRIEVGSNRLSCSVCSCISTSSHFIKVTALVEIPLSLWQL